MPATDDQPTVSATPPPTVAPTDGQAPDLATLSASWSGSVLASLSQRARPRFTAGRWLAIDGALATMGLPNAPHAARCEELRGEVEAALSAAFGTPITVRLTVDSTSIDPGDRRAVASGRSARSQEPEEFLDRETIAELEDAVDVASTGVDRIAAVFPGAELVDEPEP
jgi:hypothetical protein